MDNLQVDCADEIISQLVALTISNPDKTVRLNITQADISLTESPNND